MAVFTYIATESIQGGHVLNDQYDIEIGLEKFDDLKKSRKTEKVALNGTTSETVKQNFTTEYGIGTGFIDIPSGLEENLDWKEFIDSVTGGEAFEFDAFGTVAVPINVQNVKLIGMPTISRQVNQVVKYSFNMRVLP